MRARSALAVICALVGTVALAPMNEAAARDNRQTQKPFRVQQPGAASRQVTTPPRQAGKPQQTRSSSSRSSAAQARAAQTRATQTRTARSGQAANTSAAAWGLGLVPQAQAAALPAIHRPLGGTPILPVSVTSGLSCVPFARMATGMAISGDARTWWHSAAGVYARGQVPERGAVLSFPASGGMSRGHVAVVSRVVDARTIEIDHANWAGPGIRSRSVMRGVRVIDVSDRNDWTAVRVQVGHSAEAFGRTYATHGFIYNRPAGETAHLRVAAAGAAEEVAEAPLPHAALHMQMAVETLAR